MASYYIDKTNGNDNNTGSFLSPWKTLTKANVVGFFLPNDVLFLKRGEVWTNENLIIYNDYFTVDAYGDAEDKPKIRPCTEYYLSVDWVKVPGTDTYVLPSCLEPVNHAVFEDDLKMEYVLSGTPGPGQFLWSSGVGLTICASDSSDPRTNGRTYRVCIEYRGYIRDQHGSAIEDFSGGYLNDISYGSNIGILGLSNHSTIKNVHVEYCAHYSFGHQLGTPEHKTGITLENFDAYHSFQDLIMLDGFRDISVKNCVARYCVDSGISIASLSDSYDTGDCAIEGCESMDNNVGFCIKGDPDNVVISLSKLHDNVNGICFDSSTARYCENTIIENNEIYSNTNGIVLSGLNQDCGDDTFIRYNEIYENSENGIISRESISTGIGDRTKIYGNHIYGNTLNGISLQESGSNLEIFNNIIHDHLTESGISIENSCLGINLYNNTLYDNHEGISILTSAGGYRLINNIIRDGFGLTIYDNSIILYSSNNCYYDTVLTSDNSVVSLESLQASGLEVDSIELDPLFSSLTQPYTILENSPCIDAGSEIVGITDNDTYLDFWGNNFIADYINIGANQELVSGSVVIPDDDDDDDVAVISSLSAGIINGIYSEFIPVLRNFNSNNSKINIENLSFLVRPLNM